MKRNANLKEKYLDGEKLFRKYYEMGESRSFYLLAEWAITEGMKSSTGKNPTTMGVWKSMWRWASLNENKGLAWQIYSRSCPNSSISEWAKDMVKVKIPSAWQHTTQAKRDKFLKENGWV